MVMAVYLTAAVSSAHLSPAASIALWMFASFERRKVLPYIVVQMLRAFCDTALVYHLYYNLFFDYEQAHAMVRFSGESLDIIGTFSTYPNPHIRCPGVFGEDDDYCHPGVPDFGADRDGKGIPRCL